MKEIRHIIEYYDKRVQSEAKMALASVVYVEASAYRRVGARMLVDSNGNWVGGISGGCLEGDALRRSQKAIFNQEASIVTYDTMDDDSNQLGVGLGCNGVIKVLFDPIDSKDKNNPIEILRKVCQTKRPSIILKMVASTDHNHKLGEIIFLDELEGVEDFWSIQKKEWIKYLEEVQTSKRPQVIKTINTFSNEVEVLIEYIRPEVDLVIIGDNKDVLPLLNIANELGWFTTVLGRKRKMMKEVVRVAHNIHEYEDVSTISFHPYSVVVIMTHDYNRDKAVLPTLLNTQASYIGILGPKKRTEKLTRELNLSKYEHIKVLHSPTGLDIGAESPEEIAISIIAEIIASFRSRKGGYLKDRKKPIHQD